jgi:NAD(P)-dependent dehydrogenase (short-subunit alcohol dehydrogenase family)
MFPALLWRVCRQESVAAAQQLVAASVQGAGVQLLVNNAGICTVAPVEFFDLQSFRCAGTAELLVGNIPQHTEGSVLVCQNLTWSQMLWTMRHNLKDCCLL